MQAVQQGQAACSTASSMLPIAAVSPLLQLAQAIYQQVNIAKKNVSYCRRLAEEVQAMEPILKNIQTRVDTMPPATKEMIDKALDLLMKDFQNALDFIMKQKKTGAVKRFVVARTTDEVFHDIRNHIRDSREIFMLAMMNKIDETVTIAAAATANAAAVAVTATTTTTTPTGTTVNTESVLLVEARSPDVAAVDPDTRAALVKLKLTRQNTTPTANTLSEVSSKKLANMREAFTAKKYDESIKIGKDLLKSAPKDAEVTIVTYLSIACAYACLNQQEDAMTYLEIAKENGWDDPSFLESPDLDNIKTYPDFVSFKDKMNQEMLQNERWRHMPEVEVDYFTHNFQRYDVDGSGTICLKEFKVLMKRTASVTFTDEQVSQKFQEIDQDKSGQLALNEFLNFIADHRDYFKVPVGDLTNAVQDFSLSGSQSVGGSSPVASARPFTPPSLPLSGSSPAFSVSAPPIATAQRPVSPAVMYNAAPPPELQQQPQQQQQRPTSPYSTAPPAFHSSHSAPDFNSSYGMPGVPPPPAQTSSYAPPPAQYPPQGGYPNQPYQSYQQPPPQQPYLQQTPPAYGYAQDGASVYATGSPAYGAQGGYGVPPQQQSQYGVYGSGEFAAPQAGYPPQQPDPYGNYGAAGYPPQYYQQQGGSFQPYQSY